MMHSSRASIVWAGWSTLCPPSKGIGANPYATIGPAPMKTTLIVLTVALSSTLLPSWRVGPAIYQPEVATTYLKAGLWSGTNCSARLPGPRVVCPCLSAPLDFLIAPREPKDYVRLLTTPTTGTFIMALVARALRSLLGGIDDSRTQSSGKR
jgi:hypothetical protein